MRSAWCSKMWSTPATAGNSLNNAQWSNWAHFVLDGQPYDFPLFPKSNYIIYPIWFPKSMLNQGNISHTYAHHALRSGMAGMATHANSPWSKSRALRGTLDGVERSRVQDLQNPDPEKALAPHWRVSKLQIWHYFSSFSFKPFNQFWPMRFDKFWFHVNIVNIFL